MIGIAAANNGKTKEAADLAAELVHMGLGDLVSRTFQQDESCLFNDMWHLPLCMWSFTADMLPSSLINVGMALVVISGV